jgi:glycosyl transferase family 25
MELSKYIDKIFVINLDYRKDRLEHITSELLKVGITDFERFPAIKPTESMFKDEYNYYIHNSSIKYRIGALGCLLSHLEIIKMAKNNNYKKILIFEDDCKFTESLDVLISALQQLEEKNNKYKLLYLSGNHIKKCSPFSKNVVKVNGTFTTHSYVVTSDAYDGIISGLTRFSREIDNYYIRIYQPRNECYCVFPSMTTQIDGISDINNSFVSRFKDIKDNVESNV